MYRSCSYNGTSDNIWNTKATRETVGCLSTLFVKRSSKSKRVSGPELSRTIVLICFIPLYTHLNHMSRSVVNSFCMSQTWRSTATDFRAPLTSYSTAKLAKSSGVSSPWDDDFNRLQLGYLEANDISGWFMMICDSWLASCCIWILSNSKPVLHTIKCDSFPNMNDHLWSFEVVINSVSLNGIIHQLREPDGLELEGLRAMAGPGWAWHTDRKRQFFFGWFFWAKDVNMSSNRKPKTESWPQSAGNS